MPGKPTASRLTKEVLSSAPHAAAEAHTTHAGSACTTYTENITPIFVFLTSKADLEQTARPNPFGKSGSKHLSSKPQSSAARRRKDNGEQPNSNRGNAETAAVNTSAEYASSADAPRGVTTPPDDVCDDSGSSVTTSSGTALPAAPLRQAASSLLPYPCNSLYNLSAYLEIHCSAHLAAPRALGNAEFLESESLTMRAMLKTIGYLAHAPLLRCVVMHLLLLEEDEAQRALALRALDLLRRDVSKLYIRLESSLRELFFDVRRLRSDVMFQHSVFTAAFTIALRRDVDERLAHLKTHGETPALLIVPSFIRVANFGLFLRGSVPKDTPLMGYAGEVEQSDSMGSGYRMATHKAHVVDAKIERCLCSMMNDARFSSFPQSCRFTCGKKTKAIAIRKLENEELFVSYGSHFKFDLEDTAASFSRAVAADFAAFAKGAHLPRIAALVEPRRLQKRRRPAKDVGAKEDASSDETSDECLSLRVSLA